MVQVDDTRAGSRRWRRFGLAGVGEQLVDEITVHQSGQHTQADPVGQAVRTTVFTTGAPVDHRNRSYVESVAAQYFYKPIWGQKAVPATTSPSLDQRTLHQSNTHHHNSFNQRKH
jgi:hypothetical protein